MHIIITGNPVDGLAFHGPFDTPEEATEWVEARGDGEWWLTFVNPVKENPELPPKYVVIDQGRDQDEPVVVGPFLYEPDAVTWAEQAADRQVTQLWTEAQFAAGIN